MERATWDALGAKAEELGKEDEAKSAKAMEAVKRIRIVFFRCFSGSFWQILQLFSLRFGSMKSDRGDSIKFLHNNVQERRQQPLDLLQCNKNVAVGEQNASRTSENRVVGVLLQLALRIHPFLSRS